MRHLRPYKYPGHQLRIKLDCQAGDMLANELPSFVELQCKQQKRHLTPQMWYRNILAIYTKVHQVFNDE